MDEQSPLPQAGQMPTAPMPEPQAEQSGVPIYDISGSEPLQGTIGHEEVTEAVASGKYSLPKGMQVPVINPDGEHGTIDAAEAPEAFKAGYRYATPDDIAQHKYGSGGQQAIAGLEGAGRGIVGPLAPMIEKGLGVNEEDIRGREKANPITAGVGEAAGLVGGMLTGTGEAALAEKIGAAGAEALLKTGEPVTLAAKIGSAATKGAIENMVIQGSDETSKMILHDPEQSTQTALVDTGLSGLIGGSIGGAIGSVSPLWKATFGGKTDGILSKLAEKAGGIESVPSNLVDDAITRSGLEVAPEIRASLSNDPLVRQQAQVLMDSATGSGIHYQEALKGFKTDVSDKMIGALGKTREDVAALDNLNTNEIGENLKNSIKDTIQEQYAPIKKDYEYISNKFKDVDLPNDIKGQLADKIAGISANGASQESAEAKLVQRVLKEVPGLNNLEHLRNYTSALGRETSGIAKQELWGVAKQLREALGSAEESALNKAVADKAPELLQKHLDTNAAYKQLKQTLGDINDRIKVGPHGGPGTFLKNLSEMDGETILSRLNPSNKANIIEELSAKFPKAAEQIKDYHLNKLLKTSSKFTEDGHAINSNTLMKEISKLSPQMREFVLPPGSTDQLQGLKALVDGLPAKIGKSGTPQGLDGLMAHLPASAAGMAAMLTGHNLAVSAMLGGVTKALGRDIPDAARLGVLKFLGSDKPIQPGAFKAMVDFIHSTIKGENLVSRATSSIFKAGREVLPQSMMPTEKQTDKLDKQLKSVQKDPNALLNVGGEASHYMPEHGQAAGQTASNAVNYLNSLRPSTDRQSPLDPKLPPNPIKEAEYRRALGVAQQPLIVLDKMQKGTMTAQDVVSLKTMYPALYTKLQNQLVEHMTTQMDKGNTIPYKTRIGLSVFMAQPLDSTMQPMSIIAAQPLPKGPEATQGQGGKPPPESSVKGLNKLPGSYMTKTQQRESERSSKS